MTTSSVAFQWREIRQEIAPSNMSASMSDMYSEDHKEKHKYMEGV